MYLTQALHRAAQQHPDRVAVRFGDRQCSFGELIDRVARLAAALQALGMQRGDRVAMLSLNSDRYLEYQMAVPWGGGVLNPCNIRWSPAEILYSLNDSGSTILLVDASFAPLVEPFRREATSLREVVFCGDGAAPAGMHAYEALLAEAAPVPDALRRGEDLAGIFYTGGTTGFPKGVMLSHTNMCSSGMALRAEGLAGPDGIYLHCAPMFHLADMGLAMPHWIEGNAHSIIPVFNPEQVLDVIERDRVTHALLVPTMIQMLVDHPAMKKPRDLSSLRAIAYGASTIAEAVLERAMSALPGVEFAQAYGMTELSPLATLNPPWYHTREARHLGKLRSAGRASHCTEVRIVDPQGKEVPRGTVGEVIVRGPNVMQGYWNQPGLTAAALRDGWMHTGDGAWMDDDGFIFIADRLKDMIITGGENVYSAEVENALAQHPAVLACAVIAVPSDEWGESVHAVVVRRPDAGGRAGRADRPLQVPDRGLQVPAQRRLRRCAAAVGRRQGAQDPAARTLLAGPRARRGLNPYQGVFHEPGCLCRRGRHDPLHQARGRRGLPADGGPGHAAGARRCRHRLRAGAAGLRRLRLRRLHLRTGALYEVGLTGIPIVNVNNNCSTGSTALFLARQAVASGAADCVLALGFEQMRPGALGAVFTDRPSPFERFDRRARSWSGTTRSRWRCATSAAPASPTCSSTARSCRPSRRSAPRPAATPRTTRWRCSPRGDRGRDHERPGDVARRDDPPDGLPADLRRRRGRPLLARLRRAARPRAQRAHPRPRR